MITIYRVPTSSCEHRSQRHHVLYSGSARSPTTHRTSRGTNWVPHHPQNILGDKLGPPPPSEHLGRQTGSPTTHRTSRETNWVPHHPQNISGDKLGPLPPFGRLSRETNWVPHHPQNISGDKLGPPPPTEHLGRQTGSPTTIRQTVSGDKLGPPPPYGRLSRGTNWVPHHHTADCQEGDSDLYKNMAIDVTMPVIFQR
ncbi:NF-X1-type zinc finger protein NFXL1-like [Haliotis rufescens]|uniref:NF-X1-type zinc finger protein NFXL1-like n=1 Tax=Haliotis rufescens TaxID=6454 RepID=UPI00201E8122|nr:NF-X1-type zinc finger protein NFXL1-like [Haliotis rufescens]